MEDVVVDRFLRVGERYDLFQGEVIVEDLYVRTHVGYPVLSDGFPGYDRVSIEIVIRRIAAGHRGDDRTVGDLELRLLDDDGVVLSAARFDPDWDTSMLCLTSQVRPR